MDQRRVHKTRHDRVHPDAFGCVLERESDRELIDRRLGGIIGDVWVSGVTDGRDRRDVDDRALTLLLHDRKHVLAREKDARRVNVHDAMPALLGKLYRSAHLGYADVVVQHIDAAEALHRPFHDGANLIRLGDVGDFGVERTAGFSYDNACFLGGRGIHVYADHFRALPSEERRGRLSIAPPWTYRPCAEHQCDLAL